MWKQELRPTYRIEQVLRGRVRLEDEDPAIQSACRLPIHQGALELLAIPGKVARRAALQRIPPLIRPHVEREAFRIYDMRRSR